MPFSQKLINIQIKIKIIYEELYPVFAQEKNSD